MLSTLAILTIKSFDHLFKTERSMLYRYFPLYTLLLCFAFDLSAQISFTANSTLLNGSFGTPACVVDMNGDHLDDVVRFNGTQLVISYQQTNGTFVEQSFLNATVNPNWSICAGDLNNDGLNDLCLGNGSAVSFLYAANGGSSYTEHYIPDYIFSQRSTMADIDNNGWLDAFVCHDVDQSHPYRNDGTGMVNEDQSLINTLAVGGNYAAIWVDYDNDSDIDLYITKCRSGAPVGDPQRINLLYQNNGNGIFSEVGAAANMNDGAQSWSTVFEDFDNDGDFDAFIVNHSDANRFMLNNGNGTFTDIINTTGIAAGDLGAWESQGADFDNDGWVDIISEVGGGIYRNNGNLTFTNINISIDEGGIGDLNNDGWLDYQYGGNIYLNNGGTNHWVKVELQGIQSAQNGIGSRLELYGSWGRQIREIRSGQGFSHMNSLQGHFGIGSSTAIDSLVIKWPSGMQTTLVSPGIDQLHVVPEVECLLASSTVNVVGNTSLCPGDSVVLEAPAGYDAYNWSNGDTTQSITVSGPGTYSVVSFDANVCGSLSDLVIVQSVVPVPPTITAGGDLVICEGGSVDLTSSSSTSYLWNTMDTSQTISVTQGGTYFVQVNDQCGSITSEPVVVVVHPEPAVSAADVTLPAPGTATLMATGDSIVWYDVQTGGTPLGYGNTWETPFLSAPATFWVEAHELNEVSEVGGKPDNTGGGGLPSTGAYSYFDAWEPFVLNEVTVYALSDGMRTIQLVDDQGGILESLQVMILTGQQTLSLDWNVPVGVDMSLRCLENDLFRNNGGVQYPYAIGDVGELTGSFFGPTYYYYFYNWQLTTSSLLCTSERIPVNVDINVGITDAEAAGLELYPVPTRDLVHVEWPNVGIDQVLLLDALGRAVEAPLQRVNTDKVVVDLSDVASGSYQMIVQTADGRTVQRAVQRDR